MMAYFNFVYDYFEITTATAAIRALTIRYRKRRSGKSVGNVLQIYLS